MKKLVSALIATAVAGAIAGVGFASGASADSKFPLNHDGQSYGTLEQSSIFDGPDLIQAWSDDGRTLGYISKVDVIGQARTPEQAVGA